MPSVLDPTQPLGAVILNILASIGCVTLVAVAGWSTGPIRWWVAGRTLKQILLTGRSFAFIFDPINGKAKEARFGPNGEIGAGRNSNEHSWRIRRGRLEILAFDAKYIADLFLIRPLVGLFTQTTQIQGQFTVSSSFLILTRWASITPEHDASHDAETASRPPVG